MTDETSRTCLECEGAMSPIVVMDNAYRQMVVLTYRLPDDRPSFWTGQYATAGTVRAFMCADCGRIALYGEKPNPSGKSGPEHGL